MKIAVPVEGELLSSHFGHCRSVVLVEVDQANKRVLQTETVTAPPHEHGVLPRLLAAKHTDLVIAGGMGPGARNLLAGFGIQVVAGAPRLTPSELVTAYLNGTLVTGDGACDHHCDH